MQPEQPKPFQYFYPIKSREKDVTSSKTADSTIVSHDYFFCGYVLPSFQRKLMFPRLPHNTSKALYK